jgi:hypothetical protein
MLKLSNFDAGFLVGALRERGVSVWYDHERDKLCVWPSLVSEVEVNDLRAHKGEIVAWLTQYLPDEATIHRWQSEARATNDGSRVP